MFQVFPHHGLLTEGLRVSLVVVNRETDGIGTHFHGFLWTILNINPHAFDTNL